MTINSYDFSNLYSKSKINRTTAGAGTGGLLVSMALFFSSYLFYNSELYGAMMLVIAFAIWFYLAGTQFIQMIFDIFSIIFRSVHITDPATDIIKCNTVFRVVEKEYSETSRFDSDTIKSEDTRLIPLIKNYIEDKNVLGPDVLVNMIDHSVYSIADEHYSYNISILDFIGNTMPLFGLFGTVLGLVDMLAQISDTIKISELTQNVSVAMLTTLYGSILSIIFKILSSRFKLKREALKYDFNELSNHIVNIFRIKSV